MLQALYDGSVDYEDGTPNTASQAAKVCAIFVVLRSVSLASYTFSPSRQDVSTFLAWCSEPEADERKVCCVALH